MRNYLKLVFAMQIVTWIAIAFDLPILRQLFGFLYLTFVPGYVILKCLRNENGRIDNLLLSAGLSIVFLMFAGLFMCELLPLFGFSNPLTLFPLVAVVSGLTLFMVFLGCREDLRSKDDLPVLHTGKIKSIVRASILLVIPVLAIVGVLLDNVFILLVMITVVAVIYFLGSSSKFVPERYHLMIVLAISIAFVFQTSLISKYIMGEDIHIETFVFKSTEIRGYWSSPGVGVDSAVARFDSMLSVTILPTVYSLLLGVGQEVVFKIAFPLLYCLVPLVLYRIYEDQTNKSVALLSVFFFMSGIAFFGVEPITLARQMVAFFIFALAILVTVAKGTSTSTFNRRVFILLLGAGLTVSHYALAYLYIFLVIVVYVILRKWRSTDVLNAAIVLVLFVTVFTWYVYVSDAPLMKISSDLVRIRNNFLSDIVSPSARSTQVATLISPAATIVGVVHRIVFYTQSLFIVVGVLGLIIRKAEFMFETKYRLMSIAALLIMISCLLVPNLAPSFNLTRFYSVTIIFLAPFFVTGGITVCMWIRRVIGSWPARAFKRGNLLSFKMLSLGLVSMVLVSSFLFSIGFIEHITGTYPESWALDKYQKMTSNDIGIKMSYFTEILPDQDVASATWLSKHKNRSYLVYAETLSGILYSYALIPSDQQKSIYSAEDKNGYFYLSYVNLIEGLPPSLNLSDTTQTQPKLDASNNIYSNGASEIYSINN